MSDQVERERAKDAALWLKAQGERVSPIFPPELEQIRWAIKDDFGNNYFNDKYLVALAKRKGWQS